MQPTELKLLHPFINPTYPPPKKKVLVLDLDETLIHSTAKRVLYYDWRLEVYIKGMKCEFNVIKRPYMELFLQTVCNWFDVFIFTASVKQYACPVIDHLDPLRLIKGRLYRESCTQYKGTYIKDLALYWSDLSQVIIIDNSPVAYCKNKDNAIPIRNFEGEKAHDDELFNILPFFECTSGDT